MKSYDSINPQTTFLFLVPNKNNCFAFSTYNLSSNLILAIIITFFGSANENCEIKGEGIDYVAQVSVDGGASWFPSSEEQGLVAKVAPDGTKTAAIPYFTNKKMLQIKLKDFSKTAGLTISNYNYIKVPRNSQGNRNVYVNY